MLLWTVDYRPKKKNVWKCFKVTGKIFSFLTPPCLEKLTGPAINHMTQMISHFQWEHSALFTGNVFAFNKSKSWGKKRDIFYVFLLSVRLLGKPFCLGECCTEGILSPSVDTTWSRFDKQFWKLILGEVETFDDIAKQSRTANSKVHLKSHCEIELILCVILKMFYSYKSPSPPFPSLPSFVLPPLLSPPHHLPAWFIIVLRQGLSR